jgi:hypothetical protein
VTDFSADAENKRIIAMMDERNEFGPLEDGYIYYWPSPNMGALGPHTLRVIADELDRRNAEWDAEVQRYFSDGRQRAD